MDGLFPGPTVWKAPRVEEFVQEVLQQIPRRHQRHGNDACRGILINDAGSGQALRDYLRPRHGGICPGSASADSTAAPTAEPALESWALCEGRTLWASQLVQF